MGRLVFPGSEHRGLPAYKILSAAFRVLTSTLRPDKNGRKVQETSRFRRSNYKPKKKGVDEFDEKQIFTIGFLGLRGRSFSGKQLVCR